MYSDQVLFRVLFGGLQRCKGARCSSLVECPLILDPLKYILFQLVLTTEVKKALICTILSDHWHE